MAVHCLHAWPSASYNSCLSFSYLSYKYSLSTLCSSLNYSSSFINSLSLALSSVVCVCFGVCGLVGVSGGIPGFAPPRGLCLRVSLSPVSRQWFYPMVGYVMLFYHRVEPRTGCLEVSAQPRYDPRDWLAGRGGKGQGLGGGRGFILYMHFMFHIILLVFMVFCVYVYLCLVCTCNDFKQQFSDWTIPQCGSFSFLFFISIHCTTFTPLSMMLNGNVMTRRKSRHVLQEYTFLLKLPNCE